MGSSSDPRPPASAPLDPLLRWLDRWLVGQERAKLGLLLAAIADLPLELCGPPGCGKGRLSEAARLLAAAPGGRSPDTGRALGGGATPLSWVVWSGRSVDSEPIVDRDPVWRPPPPCGATEHGGTWQRSVWLDAQASAERRSSAERRGGAERRGSAEQSGADRERFRVVLRRTGAELESGLGLGAGSGPGASRPALRVAIRSLIASDPVGARRLLDIAAQPSSDASPVTPRESSERETQRALARRLEELRGRATRVVVPGSVLDALSRRLLRSAGASHSGSGLGDAVAERAVALIRAHASLRGSSIAEPCDLSAADFLSSIARAHEETTRDLSDAPPFEARLLSSRDLSRPDVNRASTAAPATRQGVEFGVVPAVVVNGPAARIEDCELELALRESSADSSGGVACAIPPGGEDAIARWLSRLEGALRARHGARASRATLDSAGAPRRLRALRSLEELPEADPVELWEYLSARTPHLPRVADRARRQRLAGLVVLRDVSASMQGPVGRWCARLAAAMVGLAARRGWPVGYVEFNHDARRFRSATAFMHTDHTSLRRLVTRERCDGQTSFEAPLEALLEATREGEWGHAILVTDGLPVVGDPQVAQQRRRLRERGWRVHTLFVGHGAPPPILARIARETRGTSARVRPLPAGRFRLEGTAR